MPGLNIVHFSDILCVWAYLGQSNLQNIVDKFGPQIEIETRFCSVFPDAHGKIEKVWGARGGFDAYAAHVREVVGGFPGVALNDNTWTTTRPKSSASPHLFVKALEIVANESVNVPFQDRAGYRAVAALRSAFFAEARDVSDWAVQRDISEALGVSFDDICSKIETGEAIATLAADYELGAEMHVRGSPTYILNDGRQVLFGNISTGILDANISELLNERQTLNASPC